MFREDGNVLHFSTPKGALRVYRFPLSLASALAECPARIFVSVQVAHAEPAPLMLQLTWSASKLISLFPLSLGFTVHAAVAANTFAIYGAGHVKELTELVPGILNQLGPDSLASLRKLAESYQAIQQSQRRPPAAANDDDDDDVPDLVENFEQVAVEDKEKPTEEKKDNLEELN
ncbi:hypothetical protein BD414DRAFT_496284 [Trametes punicea]|nr:hypothetical protein BD414DRAFT_496284 [Trametes punicea]